MTLQEVINAILDLEEQIKDRKQSISDLRKKIRKLRKEVVKISDTEFDGELKFTYTNKNKLYLVTNEFRSYFKTEALKSIEEIDKERMIMKLKGHE